VVTHPAIDGGLLTADDMEKALLGIEETAPISSDGRLAIAAARDWIRRQDKPVIGVHVEPRPDADKQPEA
jgi:hypothetical protein